MTAQRSYARLAGLMYLLVLAFDIAGVAIGSGHRLGSVLSLLGSMSTVLLAIGHYVTVRPIDENLALTALLFRAAEAAIGGVGVAAALSGNGKSSIAATAVAALFFCAGSTLFFYLFLRSTYIPRLLARWGVFASLLYGAYWLFTVLVPQYPAAIAVAASIPILIAEVGTGLWLLFRGIRTA